MRTLDIRVDARLFVVAVPSLVAATVLVWVLQQGYGIPNASAVYLLAVVATAIGSGTLGATASALIGFLLYDYLFTQPRFTLVVRDVGEWLNLVLLLFVGLVVGQLTAMQRSRADLAERREREARQLFAISRALSTRRSTPSVLPEIASLLRGGTDMERVWISLGHDDATERVAAVSAERDAGAGVPAGAGTPAGTALPVGAGVPPAAGTLPHDVLRRMPGDVPATWVRVSPPAGARFREPGGRHEAAGRAGEAAGRAGEAAGRARDSGQRQRERLFRVRIESGESILGSIWGARSPRRPPIGQTSTRLLSAAADQIGQALTQDRLAAEARAAEVSRESDALKSALLQSVSHDLRTPLAAIRAAAGTLRPDSGLDHADRRASADAIEVEVQRLDRLVANLLDLSRIEAGALRAQREAFELDDIVGRSVERLRPQLASHDVRVDLASDPVLVDPVFLDEVVANVLENAAKFAPSEAVISVGSDSRAVPGFIRLTIEDGGPGVPPEGIGRIFDKFYRHPGASNRARPGTGIGLSVVRGLADAMGVRVTARPSELGGLAIDLDLPAATLPAELAPASPAAPTAPTGRAPSGPEPGVTSDRT